jgi:hypothetical protein
MLKTLQACTLVLVLDCPMAIASGPDALVLTTEERLALHHGRFLESRRIGFVSHSNVFDGPSIAQVIEESPAPWRNSSFGWHHQISTTVFWVGEPATQNNPVSNVASAWNPNWLDSFGGFDDPIRRSGYAPEGLLPQENPFYFALPYNDLDSTGRHRAEAAEVIPWFWREFKGPSISVCKDRWIAIHKGDRICYAQWKDVGPFTIDDWQYVFDHKKPRPNRNGDAGLDVSPSVRDYLGLKGMDRVAWRFVEDAEVPQGPWSTWKHPQVAKEGAPQR